MPNLTAYGAFQSTSRFGCLDGLRCIAVLCVVWSHGPGLLFLAHFGYAGVQLFFAISGFLITTLLLRERTRTGSISLRDFYARRALRIFPLYYTLFFVYLGAVFAFERHQPRGVEFLSNAPYIATFTSNWRMSDNLGVILGHTWSLAVEEQFYLLWPMLLAAIGRPAAWIALALAFVSPALFAGGRISPALFWGALLAVVLDNPHGFSALWVVFGRRGAAFVMAFLFAGTILIRVAQPAHGFLMAALVAACVIREDNVLASPLRWPPIAKIGIVSYGVYLLHPALYSSISRVGSALSLPLKPHDLLAFFLVLTMTMAAALLSFRYLETPFLRLRARFSPR